MHKQNANTEAARPPSSPVVAVAVALKFEAYGHGFRQKGCSVVLTCDVKILVREGIAVPERDGKRLSLCAVPTETPLHQNGALAVQWHSGEFKLEISAYLARLSRFPHSRPSVRVLFILFSFVSYFLPSVARAPLILIRSVLSA